MENYNGSSNDTDAQLKRSYESYQSPEEKEKKEKDKKKKKQQSEEKAKAEATKRSAETSSKDSFFGEKKSEESKKPPSFLSALLGEKPNAGEKKSANKVSEEKKAAPPSVKTERESSAEVHKSAELSAEEQREAAVAYVAQREARLATEAAEAERTHDEAAANEVFANQSFLQRLKTKLLGGQSERSNSELLDEAAAEAIEDVTDEQSEANELTAESAVANAHDVPELDRDRVDPADDSEDFTLSQQPPRASASSAAPPPHPPIAASSGGTGGGGGPGGGAPPPPPIGPDGSGGGPELPFDALANNSTGRSPTVEFASTVASGAAETARRVERGARRTAGAGEFLLGAFVGYLFGRRRGRLNSEAEHLPVKKQLEKEVKQLQSDIEAREEQVRAAARQRQTDVASVSPQPELHSSTQSRVEVASEKAEDSVDKTNRTTNESTPEDQTVNALDAVENTPEQTSTAKQEVASSFRTRELAAPIVAANVEASVSNQAKTKEALNQLSSNGEQQVEHIATRATTKERVATMPLPEVLEQAQQITFHGETLRDMYESNQIDEKTLRETLKAFHGGERFERKLEQQLQKLHEAAVSVDALEQQRQTATDPPRQPDYNQQTTQHKGSSSRLDALAADTEASVDTSAVTNDMDTPKDTSGSHLTPMRQATIGAVIGIVFVVIIILLLT